MTVVCDLAQQLPASNGGGHGSVTTAASDCLPPLLMFLVVHCRNLEDTDVEPQRCHDKVLSTVAPAAARARAAAALLQAGSSAPAWLPVAVLAAALGAVFSLLLLIRRRDAPPSERSTRYSSLHSDTGSQNPGSTADQLGPWPGSNGAAVGALRRRRQRVASMLRTGAGGVRMHQLAELPNDMAHCMAPLSRMALHAPAQVDLAAWQRSSAVGPAAFDSWGWQLGSHSLAIPVEDLHVRWAWWLLAYACMGAGLMC